MPGWWEWGKKSSKNKEEKLQQQDNPYGKNDVSTKKTTKKKPKSFDEVVLTRNSPRGSKDLAGGSSGFSGFDSDSVEKRGLPLPTPSGSGSDHGISGIGLGSGSASGSMSSVSSSGSSGEDHPISNEHNSSLFGVYR